MTPRQYSLEHRRAYQKWYRDNKKKPADAMERRREYAKKRYAARRSRASQNNGSNVEPVALTSCPCCSARFYAARGSV